MTDSSPAPAASFSRIFYVSREFGDLTFKVTQLELQDGRKVHFGGEHDFPYLDDYGNVIPLPEPKDE